MKKYKFNIVILVLITFIIMYLALKDDFNSTIKYLTSVDIPLFLISILFYILYLFFQTSSLHLFINGIDSKYKFKNTFILILSAQFFNGITPFSSGGQPFQMYLMKKQGIKLTDSGSALLQNFLSTQIALILLGTFSIVMNYVFNIIPQNNLLRRIVLIGYLINVIVLFVLWFLSRARKTNINLFNKIINFVFSFKFLKNKENIKEKLFNKIDDFYNSSVYFKNNVSNLIKSVLLNTISFICLYIIPFFVFLSIGETNSISIFESIVCSGYTYLIGSFVPIPGGTGGLEYGFVQFFQNFTVGATLSACMILWRFITYYFGIILGAFSLLFYKREVKK